MVRLQGSTRGPFENRLLPMRWLSHPWVKPVVFVLWLLPLAWLSWALWADRLGANPAEALIRSLGDWTLRALVLLLAVTPLRVMAATPALARLRRMLGLFVFFYASLHWLAYVWLDMDFEWPEALSDVSNRPFILVGTLAWLVLLALAATSFDKAIRAMGAKRWQWLHRSVYGVAGLALLHFYWMRVGKNDFAEVIVYAVFIGVLLAWRARRRCCHR